LDFVIVRTKCFSTKLIFVPSQKENTLFWSGYHFILIQKLTSSSNIDGCDILKLKLFVTIPLLPFGNTSKI
jgi:hypothetical protein